MEDPVMRREYESNQLAIWKEIARLRGILEGPPHPGLEMQVTQFLTEFRTLEMERDRQHKSNRWRLDAIIALLGVVAAYLLVVHR